MELSTFPTFTVCFIENVIINIYFYMDYLSQDEILIYIKLFQKQ